MLQYKTYSPHPALRSYIHLYATLEEPILYESRQVERNPPVINKGLMFHYKRDGSLILENEPKLRGEFSRGFIMAQGTAPNTWKYYGGFGIFAVIFKPGKFRYFFADPMLEFLDDVIPFEDYNDPELLELYEQIMIASDTFERIDLADKYLLKKIRYWQYQEDWLQFAMKEIYRKPQLKIKDIQFKVRVSQKHFRAQFGRHFGIAPKSMQQLMRMNHVLNVLSSKQKIKLTDVAYSHGFTDQAHFNRVFKYHMGITPSAYRKAASPITQYITHKERL